MARIAGVDLPRRKHVAYALPYLYGIGPALAREICKKTGIPGNTPVLANTRYASCEAILYTNSGFCIGVTMRL